MTASVFKDWESAAAGTSAPTEQLLKGLAYNDEGLIPAIAQDASSGDVLMMAWMNRESIAETLATRQVCYWSRSRKKFWRKGEESGHVQMLVRMRTDCDGDTLLLTVDQSGPACHTNRSNCFYIELADETTTVVQSPPGDS